MIQRLTPFVYTEGEKYRFRLEERMRVRLSGRWWLGSHRFADDNGRVWMSTDGREITVEPGYAWDGSSPKFRILGRWVGTPDYEGTRLASMIHDTLYQFLHAPCFPLKRSDCDRVFGEIMKSERFPLWWVYSGAVLTFGGIHHGAGTLFGGRRPGKCLIKI